MQQPTQAPTAHPPAMRPAGPGPGPGLRLVAALQTPRVRDERGDVPGWVMIAVMTAGIVTLLIGIAGPTLAQMLRDALGSVR